MLILTRCVRKNVKILKVLITITNIIVPLEPGRWSGGANLLGEAKRVGGMPWPPAPASEGVARRHCRAGRPRRAAAGGGTGRAVLQWGHVQAAEGVGAMEFLAAVADALFFESTTVRRLRQVDR